MKIVRVTGLLCCLLIAAANPTLLRADLVPASFEFNPQDVLVREVIKDGHTYIRIDFDPQVKKAYHLAEFHQSDSSGYPELSCRNAHFVIPQGHAVVDILNLQYTETVIYEAEEDIYVIPSQPPAPTLEGYNYPGFQHPNIDLYQNLPQYPEDENIVEVVKASGQFENITVAAVRITPFVYHPSSGVLKLLSSISFQLETAPYTGQRPPLSHIQHELEKPFQMISPPYLEYPGDQQKMNMLENPGDSEEYGAPFEIIEQPSNRTWIYELIVIPDSSYIDAAEQLRIWRIDTHRPAIVFTHQEIDGMWADGDLPEKIRQTFKRYYTYNGAQALVLVGDEPIRYLYHTNTNSPKDLPDLHIGNCVYLGEFSKSYLEWDWDGDGIYGEPDHDRPDLYTEGVVGVIPADNPGEFQVYVDKVIRYEKYGPGAEMLYYTTCVDQMRDTYLYSYYPRHIPEYIEIDTISGLEVPTGIDPAPTAPLGQEIIDYYRYAKPAFVNESSHGAPHHNTGKTRFYNQFPKSYVSTTTETEEYGSINDLENSDVLMTMWTVSCDVAAYDAPEWFGDYRCMGEGYTFVPNGGTIVYFGHSRWGWIYASKYMAAKYWDHLFNTEGQHIAGFAFRNARIDYPNYLDECYTMNLFGDPAMSIYTDIPQEITTFGPDSVDMGMNIFDFLVLDPDDDPLEDATVCFRQGEDYYLGFVTDHAYILDKDSSLIRWEVVSQEPIYFTVSAWAREDHNFLTTQRLIYVRDPGLARHNDFEDNERGDNADIPKQFALAQNYPNPFNASTVIKYDLPEDCNVKMQVYNLLGKVAATLIDEPKSAGYHSITFNGSELASGVYYLKINADKYNRVRKMVLLK